MNRVLETERLWLRPLELADAEAGQRLFPQWEVVRLLNAKVPWPFPADGVAYYYREDVLPAMERGDEWHWTLRLKSAPEELIGAIGLFRSGENNRGFWLAPQWSGQGLMTEVVIAVNDFWFEELGMERLRAPKAVENVGSRRISEKTGMRVVEVKESEFVSGRLATEVWEITAEEWQAWKQRR